MTQEEQTEFKAKFAEVWKEFNEKYPNHTFFPLEEVANYFFEKGREDVMDRVWKEIRKK